MEIGIGIVGGGYMGKAHAVAMTAVGAVFNTELRPKLEFVCSNSIESAERYQKEYGFANSTNDWRKLVSDPRVNAVIIASPQSTHREIAITALRLGKPVFCEKPLGASLDDSRAMVAVAEETGVVNMVGFNYIRTPASQLARQLISEGTIGEINFLRAEHTEDFLADSELPANWRTQDLATGTMGDLSPHIINATLALVGPVNKLSAMIKTVYKTRKGLNGTEDVSNDDHAQIMVSFENGAMGQLYISRIAAGKKMGYMYEIYGTKGTIKFDQEDQNSLWLYQMGENECTQGFRKILTGPVHPDYKSFCLGPGHGTGYQDQIIIEAKDFLNAILKGKSIWPTFHDGLEVSRIVFAAWESNKNGTWIELSDI